MKTIQLISASIIQLLIAFCVSAQQNEFVPDLTKIKDSTQWTAYNREISFDKVVYLNGKPGDGLLLLKLYNFKNGTIELDIKGKDERGMSFVGFAFHGLNESTYDAIYFRPFNFKNSERNGHSVQYVSQPEFTWEKLRNEHPGKYENTVSPVPEPNEWFHATIVVDFPVVKVFVNSSTKPALTVTQLSSRKQGWVGFWVGNNSEGYFKNLKITSK